MERLFQTFQDRLIKEMRLARVATIEAATHFLAGYLPRDNRRFAVPPAQAADLHRPTPPTRELDGSLCLKTTRCLRKDFTIVYQGQRSQIHDTVRAAHVRVEHRLDGTMRLTHQGRALDVHAIAVRPSAPVVEVTAVRRPRRPVVPKLDHPWRKRLLPKRGEHAAAGGTYTGQFYLGRNRTFLNWVDRLNSDAGQNEGFRLHF